MSWVALTCFAVEAITLDLWRLVSVGFAAMANKYISRHHDTISYDTTRQNDSILATPHCKKDESLNRYV
jgi:hypothetical protein